MTRIAILDTNLPHQLQIAGEELEGVDVVWSGTSARDMEEQLGRFAPHVLVLNLGLLGEEPITQIERLRKASGQADLVITLYNFAKREVLQQIAESGGRPAKAPISVERLKSQMMSVVIKHMLAGGGAATSDLNLGPARTESLERPERGDPEKNPGTEPILPRRYTEAQLSKLLEISSTVDCECPNHLSDLVQSLRAFEDYSKNCENKNDADAAMHARLYRETARARSIMERALEALCEFEGIRV